MKITLDEAVELCMQTSDWKISDDLPPLSEINGFNATKDNLRLEIYQGPNAFGMPVSYSLKVFEGNTLNNAFYNQKLKKVYSHAVEAYKAKREANLIR